MLAHRGFQLWFSGGKPDEYVKGRTAKERALEKLLKQMPVLSLIDGNQVTI